MSHKRKVGSSSPPRGASSIPIGRRDSVVQVRCPGKGVFRQPEMRDGEGAVQPGDAGESVPAIPPVDINTRAANRQTVELALDGAVQFGIVHVLEHGIASLTASVLDFGGERMSEAELVSLMRSQKALQFVFLACCNGYEAACYSCLRGRYWIASAMCAGWNRSLPARSAIVRAGLSTRWHLHLRCAPAQVLAYARALRFIARPAAAAWPRRGAAGPSRPPDNGRAPASDPCRHWW